MKGPIMFVFAFVEIFKQLTME